MSVQEIIREITDLLNERHEGCLSVDNPNAIEIDDEGEPTGHIYDLGVTASFVPRLNRGLVESVIALVLVRHGVTVLRYDTYYIVAQKKATRSEFHHLYCNDGFVVETSPLSTTVFADELCGSFCIQEEDGGFSIKYQAEKDFTEVLPLRESDITLPEPISRQELWGG